MKMSLLMIPLFWLTVDAVAQTTPLYRWYPLKTRFPEGECILTSTSKDGKEYVEKLKPEACRPAKTTFSWQREQCFEIDEETQGQRFGMKAETEKCAPAESAFSFDPKTRQCWVVDQATGGQRFKRVAKNDECRPAEEDIKLAFIPSTEKPVGGDCLEVHKDLGQERWARRLDLRKCKPAATTFSWLSTGPRKGECWETANGDARAWSAPAQAQNCRPSNVVYRFVRTAETTGECFEVDSETEGQRWAIKTTKGLCREN